MTPMRAENLKQFVGAVGVYGDMNDILIDNMASFKGFVEEVEPEVLAAARAQDRETLREGNKQFWENFRVGPSCIPISNAHARTCTAETF